MKQIKHMDMRISGNYLFFKIHPINFLFAFYYSFRGTVFAYEIHMPEIFCRRFRRLDPEDYVNWDGWSAIKEKAAYIWKDIIQAVREKKWKISILGYETDFTNIATEVLGREYEKIFILMELIEKAKKGTYYLLEPGLFRFFSSIFPNDYIARKNEFIKKSNINVKLDYINEFALNLLYFAQFLKRILRLILLAFKKTHTLHFEYFWCGINPKEQNGRTDKLDFAWAVEQKIFLPDKVLYFLPAGLNRESYRHYKIRKVNFREHKKYFDDLNGITAIKALLSFIRSLNTSSTGISSPYCGQLIFRFACQSYLWCALAKYHKTKTYITSQSSVWPERPEVAVYNAMGIRTITWSYSSNYMLYRTDRLIGTDAQIALSALESKEFFVWNKLSADWVNSRLLNEKKPEIKVIGPLMNGNPKICMKSPEEARRLLGIKQIYGAVYISVYDMPTLSKETRLKYCMGPSPYPEEMVTAFYKDVIKLSEIYNQIILILKPKHFFDERKITYPKTVMDYYKSRKILFMEHNINPYAPIASSDICIAMPFTSPVLAGVHFRRLGLYHDPLNVVKSHMYHKMDMMISHNYYDLETKIGFLLSGEGKEWFQNLLKSGILNYFTNANGIFDPAEEFKEAVFGKR